VVTQRLYTGAKRHWGYRLLRRLFWEPLRHLPVSLAACLARASVLQATYTLCPSLLNLRAASRPMPLLAPGSTRAGRPLTQYRT
jgi:hypothetical protein